jgi:ABC-type uncharacterized transport system ATPase subunit
MVASSAAAFGVVGAGKTVLCIAHRLHTIMEYDAVLVLERGTLGEYDDPAVLLGLRPASTAASDGAELCGKSIAKPELRPEAFSPTTPASTTAMEASGCCCASWRAAASPA